jgi:hypothetical protein
MVNVPAVTFFVPVAAVPGTAIAVNAKVPDTLVAVSAVTVTVPLPLRKSAAQLLAALPFCVNSSNALFPACDPPAAPGITNVPGARAATARAMVYIESPPPSVRVPVVSVAYTPVVAVHVVPSIRAVIEPRKPGFEPELDGLLDEVLEEVPVLDDGLVGLFEPHALRLTSKKTATITRTINPFRASAILLAVRPL